MASTETTVDTRCLGEQPSLMRVCLQRFARRAGPPAIALPALECLELLPRMAHTLPRCGSRLIASVDPYRCCPLDLIPDFIPGGRLQ